MTLRRAPFVSRVATRIVRRPAIPLAIGVAIFGALAIGVGSYQPGGFGGAITAPAGTDSAAGTALLTKHFPTSSANPTNLVYKLSQPVWDNPAPIAAATSQPCTVILLGRWNWWPAALSRKAPTASGEEGTERHTQPAAPGTH